MASGCGEQEVGVASGSGWNLWVWLLGVVLRRYIDFLILLIPTPLVSVLFGSSIIYRVYRLYDKSTDSMIHKYNNMAFWSRWGPPRKCATRKRIAGRIRVRGYTWSAQSGSN